MTIDSIKRYTVSGDIAYPIYEDTEGDYVTYEDHFAAIEADRKRRGEPVVQFRSMHCADWYDGYPDRSDGGGSYETRTLYTAPQPTEHNIDYKQLYEQMCNRCDSLDAKLAEYERMGEPVAWQPIETAPHGEEVLLGWLEWDGAWKMEVSPASWGRSTKTASNISAHGQATHWMPLPAAPQPDDPSGAPTLQNADSGAQNGIQATQPAEPVKVPSDDERAAQGLPPYNPRLPTDEEMKRLTENGRKAWGKDDTEPVKVPSDSAILFEWSQTPNTGDMRVDLVVFARALLARYTITQEQP